MSHRSLLVILKPNLWSSHLSPLSEDYQPTLSWLTPLNFLLKFLRNQVIRIQKLKLQQSKIVKKKFNFVQCYLCEKGEKCNDLISRALLKSKCCYWRFTHDETKMWLSLPLRTPPHPRPDRIDLIFFDSRMNLITKKRVIY